MKVEFAEEIFFCVWEVPLASSVLFECKILIFTNEIPVQAIIKDGNP